MYNDEMKYGILYLTKKSPQCLMPMSSGRKPTPQMKQYPMYCCNTVHIRSTSDISEAQLI